MYLHFNHTKAGTSTQAHGGAAEACEAQAANFSAKSRAMDVMPVPIGSLRGDLPVACSRGGRPPADPEMPVLGVTGPSDSESGRIFPIPTKAGKISGFFYFLESIFTD